MMETIQMFRDRNLNTVEVWLDSPAALAHFQAYVCKGVIALGF